MWGALDLRHQLSNLGRDLSDDLEVDVRRRCGNDARYVLRLPDCYTGQTAKADNLAGRGIDSLNHICFGILKPSLDPGEEILAVCRWVRPVGKDEPANCFWVVGELVD